VSLLIVPNQLRDTLYEKIDAQLVRCPAASVDREWFYKELLGHYTRLGYVPDFELVPDFRIAMLAGAQGVRA
jgi:hypothetical protein